jgi:immunity protein Imm1 of predicted polymorphic toxin system
MGHGPGQPIWYGPSGGAEQLRLDVDYEVERAMVTWLPDGTYGVELDPAMPLEIMWSSDAATVTIPAEFVRVSLDTARRAVFEYIATGERPTCLSWEKQPAGRAFLATSQSNEYGPA